MVVAPYPSFGYRGHGTPGSTGAGCREAEGGRGCVGSLETGSPRGSTGSASGVVISWAGARPNLLLPRSLGRAECTVRPP